LQDSYRCETPLQHVDNTAHTKEQNYDLSFILRSWNVFIHWLDSIVHLNGILCSIIEISAMKKGKLKYCQGYFTAHKIHSSSFCSKWNVSFRKNAFHVHYSNVMTNGNEFDWQTRRKTSCMTVPSTQQIICGSMLQEEAGPILPLTYLFYESPPVAFSQ